MRNTGTVTGNTYIVSDKSLVIDIKTYIVGDITNNIKANEKVFINNIKNNKSKHKN